MLEKLQKLNIAVNEKLSVRDVSSNFKYHFIGSPDIRTSKSYQLELNEPKQIPDVIISLEELGISNINLDRLDHTEIDQFKKNARIQAIKDAKTKATYLLDAVDEELGKLIYIKELTTEDLGNTLQGRATGIIVRSATMHGSSSKQYQSIEFEKIKIEYKILAKFKIK